MEDQCTGSGVKKQSEVNSQLDRQKGCIEALKDMIKALETRLQYVLRPDQAGDECKKEASAPVQQHQVPLAEELHVHNRSIESSVGHIQGIIDRLGV